MEDIIPVLPDFSRERNPPGGSFANGSRSFRKYPPQEKYTSEPSAFAKLYSIFPNCWTSFTGENRNAEGINFRQIALGGASERYRRRLSNPIPAAPKINNTILAGSGTFESSLRITMAPAAPIAPGLK